MLLPRELDMIAAGKNMPLPVPKPKIPDDEVKAEDAKTGAAKTESKPENGKKDDKSKPEAGKADDAAKASRKSQAGPARPKPGS